MFWLLLLPCKLLFSFQFEVTICLPFTGHCYCMQTQSQFPRPLGSFAWFFCFRRVYLYMHNLSKNLFFQAFFILISFITWVLPFLITDRTRSIQDDIFASSFAPLNVAEEAFSFSCLASSPFPAVDSLRSAAFESFGSFDVISPPGKCR